MQYTFCLRYQEDRTETYPAQGGRSARESEEALSRQRSIPALPVCIVSLGIVCLNMTMASMYGLQTTLTPNPEKLYK